jgi:hypothetical protein
MCHELTVTLDTYIYGTSTRSDPAVARTEYYSTVLTLLRPWAARSETDEVLKLFYAQYLFLPCVNCASHESSRLNEGHSCPSGVIRDHDVVEIYLLMS